LYRGYYYDKETGLYYLQSRYYDPEVGRFLNADVAEILFATQGEIFGANLFVYCENNPVMYFDPTGYINFNAINNGKEFMKLIYEMDPDFIKNTKSFYTSYGLRIPDIINKSKSTIGEIKHVKYISNTKQMKGILEISQRNNAKFLLIINKSAKISKPLLAGISKVSGEIIRVASSDVMIAFSFITADFLKIIEQTSPSKHNKKTIYCIKIM